MIFPRVCGEQSSIYEENFKNKMKVYSIEIRMAEFEYKFAQSRLQNNAFAGSGADLNKNLHNAEWKITFWGSGRTQEFVRKLSENYQKIVRKLLGKIVEKSVRKFISNF